jgi:hypothetical protein
MNKEKEFVLESATSEYLGTDYFKAFYEFELRLEAHGYVIYRRVQTEKLTFFMLWVKSREWVDNWLPLDANFTYLRYYNENGCKNPTKYYATEEEARKYFDRLVAGSVKIA